MTDQKTNPELMALIEAIVAELNKEDEKYQWQVIENPSSFTFVQADDGRKFAIRYSWKHKANDRLEISGSYPYSGSYTAIASHLISVSSAKSPKVIARDISRRFLPKFHETWDLAVTRKKRNDEFKAAQQRDCQLLAEAFGGEVRQGGERIRFDGALTDNTWGNVQVNTGTVTIEIHNVPVPLAEKIGALILAEHDRGKEETGAA